VEHNGRVKILPPEKIAFFPVDDRKVMAHTLIAVFLFVIAFLTTQVDFKIVWRYFGWSNQMLSMLVLWASAMFLVKISGTEDYILSPFQDFSIKNRIEDATSPTKESPIRWYRMGDSLVAICPLFGKVIE